MTLDNPFFQNKNSLKVRDSYGNGYFEDDCIT